VYDHPIRLRTFRAGEWIHKASRGPADGVVIWTLAPIVQAVQTRRIDCDPSWKSKISDISIKFKTSLVAPCSLH
jgi:hypothetical protein